MIFEISKKTKETNMKLGGMIAIEAAEHDSSIELRKHEDPTDPARSVSISEARDIARQDPGLIWCEAPKPDTIGGMIVVDLLDRLTSSAIGTYSHRTVDHVSCAIVAIDRLLDAIALRASDGRSAAQPCIDSSDWGCYERERDAAVDALREIIDRLRPCDLAALRDAQGIDGDDYDEFQRAFSTATRTIARLAAPWATQGHNLGVYWPK